MPTTDPTTTENPVQAGPALPATAHDDWLPALAGLARATGATVSVNLGWDLAMAEHVPDEMLSRAYSYDMLGSFVAIPVGQLVFGPLGLAFGIQPVMLASGIAFVTIALVTLTSRSVRDLRRVTGVVSTTSAPAP